MVSHCANKDFGPKKGEIPDVTVWNMGHESLLYVSANGQRGAGTGAEHA